MIATTQGRGTIRAGKGTIKAGQSIIRASQILMPPQPLTNFEIQKCCQNEPEFNGVYSRNNLPKTKDGAYEIHKCWWV